MILAPQEINPLITEPAVIEAARELADTVNVVVLVPSARRADAWSGVADVITAADGIGEAVERLRSGHVGLTVLISKYDGIDLPGDACRLLIVDGLPEAYGAADRREAQLLSETDAMVGRQLQRIEQGMGRGVRSADDFCGSCCSERAYLSSLRIPTTSPSWVQQRASNSNFLGKLPPSCEDGTWQRSWPSSSDRLTVTQSGWLPAGLP
jgi:hypothetical protein